MRLGRDKGMTAATIVNSWSEKDLATLFRDYGEERQAQSIARAIVQRRREKPFMTTTDLAEVIVRAMKFSRGVYQRIHPATKIFQALRLAVNEELENLRQGIAGALRILTGGGRLAVISFHSLEDRIVKQAFREAARDCLCPPMSLGCVCGHRAIGSVLTKKPVRPSSDEVAANPRARSAKLRVFKKI
jgi:16S rRNA (cytosine1402-N4)-methyltransferase